MKITKDDLNGSSGSRDVDPQKVVDQNLSAQSAAGGGSMKEIMAEVRQTIQEFNGLTQELKNNPTVAKAIASQGGGSSFQEEGGEQEKVNVDADTAFNLFLNGINSLKEQLGQEATLQESEDFLNENEGLVKAQVKKHL